MRWNKIKTVFAGVVFAVSVMVTGVGVQAATKDLGKKISYVGDTLSYYDVIELKINGKAPSKVKKKIKVAKTGTTESYSTYRTKSYFNTSDAYATYQDYEKENGDQAQKYKPTESDYELTFKKPGTYKISSAEYVQVRYSIGNGHTDPVSHKDVYDVKKYNPVKDEYEVVTTATYVSSGQQAEEDFYQGANGIKYAYGDEGYVPVSLAKCADKKTHVRYTPAKLEKVTYTKTYKVLATKDIVKSVKLGKATNKNSTSLKEGGSSTSIKRGKRLSGKSGKVVVSMADKNYKLTGILACTYDADSNPVYNKVGNKKTVTFGTNAERYNTTEDSWWRTTMYKPTKILVLYKNAFTGESTVINSQSKDAQGNTTYVITRTYTSENPSTGKDVLLTRTYNVTRKKQYETSKYYYYYYTVTGQSWNYSTERYEKTSYSGSTSDLSSILGNYKVFTFYMK